MRSKRYLLAVDYGRHVFVGFGGQHFQPHQLQYRTGDSAKQHSNRVEWTCQRGHGQLLGQRRDANAVTVTFQGTLAGQPVPPLSAISSLQGTNPTISVGSTTQGSGDPGLTVAAPGVLANDTTTTTDQLTASLVTPPADGTLTLNANGSFTYVPSTGYLGPDSFVYAATDSGIPTGGGNTPSATATVTLHVTPRLSIPTNLTVSPSGSVVVPVIMDNPNPSGSASNGLVNAVLAIDYNPSVFAEGGVSLGTLTSSWSAPTVTLNPSLGEIAIVLSTTMPVTYLQRQLGVDYLHCQSQCSWGAIGHYVGRHQRPQRRHWLHQHFYDGTGRGERPAGHQAVAGQPAHGRQQRGRRRRRRSRALAGHRPCQRYGSRAVQLHGHCRDDWQRCRHGLYRHRDVQLL